MEVNDTFFLSDTGINPSFAGVCSAHGPCPWPWLAEHMSMYMRTRCDDTCGRCERLRSVRGGWVQ